MSLWRLFKVFFLMGASGFGSSMIPYYRSRLVDQLGWVDEEYFLHTLKIAQTLPGLNATNMSVMIGDKLCGPMGSVVATVALLLPGAVTLCAMGGVFTAYRHNPHLTVALECVAAGAAGLLLATAWRLGRPQFLSRQVVILLTTVFAVSYLGVTLPLVLLTLTPISIWLARTSRTR